MLGKVLKIVVPILALIVVATMMIVATRGASMPVIDTRGVVGDAQRDILFFAVGVMLLVVVPVFVMLFTIAFRYRQGNTKARYMPEWGNNKRLEALWWGVPILIIVVLSVVTWQTSHSLDPYKPLESDKKPLQVQVVALQWKWLFIYPDYGVASVGEFAMPVDAPVAFTITSDAPMNSFWIPQLGGQVYAMAGMSTKLHLSARETGDYRGVSANISGEGHASMTFTAKALSDQDFSQWIERANESSSALDTTAYETLRQPGTLDAVRLYALRDTKLYDMIIARYSGGHSMDGNEKTTHEESY